MTIKLDRLEDNAYENFAQVCAELARQGVVFHATTQGNEFVITLTGGH